MLTPIFANDFRSSQRRLGPKPIYVEDIPIVILNECEESIDPSTTLRMTNISLRKIRVFGADASIT